ncbi:MAG: GAF domain-containing protein, partial [Pseudomonadota bacterium]|nr:GAF domain-containing protein [Pseudomonadota bacterium]
MTADTHLLNAPSSATRLLVDPRRAILLRELGILDSESEPSFDGLTQAARLLTGCPIALVSLLDVGRQWFKSKQGLQASETPIAWSFCVHAAQQSDLFEVEDTWTDPRFSSNPLVTGAPHIRFYAGRPLTLDGVSLGSLCVIDTRPRRLSIEVRQSLEGLAHAVEGLIASRRATVALQDQRQRLVDIACASGDWLWEADAQGRVFWSAARDAEAGAEGPLRVGHRLPDGALLDTRGEPLHPAVMFHELLALQTKVVSATFCPTTQNGTACLSFSALPRFGAAGELLGFRGTARDVSIAVAQERKRYAADLNLRLERDAAQQVARLRSEVVSR